MSGQAVCQVCYRPTGDAAFLCPTEQALLERLLKDMAGLDIDDRGHRRASLFVDLEQASARQSRSGNAVQTFGSGGNSEQLPYDADREGSPKASRVADELATCLITTAREYGADDLPGQRADLLRTLVERGATSSMRKQRRRELDAIRDQIRTIEGEQKLLLTSAGVAEWILGRLYVIRLSGTCGDTYREIVRRYNSATYAADRGGREMSYLADCSTLPDGSDETCGTPLRIHVRSDAREIACPRCRTVYQVADLVAVRDAAVDSGLATMREIADAKFRLPWSNRILTLKMIEGYRRRDRIAPHGERDGVSLYRIGEVKDAAFAADRPRTA